MDYSEVEQRYKNFIKHAVKNSYVFNEIDLSKDSNKKEFDQIVDICIKDQKERLYFLFYNEDTKKETLKKLNLKSYEEWNDLWHIQGHSRCTHKVLYDFSCLMFETDSLEEKIKKLEKVFVAIEPNLYRNIDSLNSIISQFSVDDNLSPS